MPADDPVFKEINPWLIAIAVMSSTFMEVHDTTVVNVSLPHIAGHLSASTDEATWTLIVSRGQCHYFADDGMAGYDVRAQTPAHVIGNGLHRRFFFLWTSGENRTSYVRHQARRASIGSLTSSGLGFWEVQAAARRIVKTTNEAIIFTTLRCGRSS
jgi:hypothetical protein